MPRIYLLAFPIGPGLVADGKVSINRTCARQLCRQLHLNIESSRLNEVSVEQGTSKCLLTSIGVLPFAFSAEATMRLTRE